MALLRGGLLACIAACAWSSGSAEAVCGSAMLESCMVGSLAADDLAFLQVSEGARHTADAEANLAAMEARAASATVSEAEMEQMMMETRALEEEELEEQDLEEGRKLA
mmetsp:Transcript_54127/g.156310  ORF Transcript_54127/g.156310 Transcript_54127/m.156310 type:complete len:108 (-) Transcript_54127:43-366(-)